MNLQTDRLIDMDKQYLWHPFTQMAAWLASEPLVIERGEGFYLIDTRGRRYIDGVSSLWCNVHGHRVEYIDAAIKAQLDRIAHSTLLGLAQTRSIELAQRLVAIVPAGLEKVFYSDSGATAVEIAVKIAYQYWQNIGQKKRTRFIALRQSYHGDTIGSVSIGGMELFHRIFRPLLFETLFVPSPHPYRFDGTPRQCADHSLEKLELLLKTNTGQIAAVVAEPLVQGAAGIIVHPAGFLKALEQLCRKYDVLLIADEVATGFGRTGKMFACEHEDVRPDIICLAKGITGGYLPLAATITTGKIFDAFLGTVTEHKTFYHGHTYTGNALASAAAIANLDLFEKNRLIESMPAKIKLISQTFEKVRQLPYIGDARHCGLMCGIEIVKDKDTKDSLPPELAAGAKVCSAMRDKGLILRPLGDVVVIMPPVAIDQATLRELLEIVYDTLKNELPVIVK